MSLAPLPARGRWQRSVLAGFALARVVAACGNDDDGGADTTADRARPPTTIAGTTPASQAAVATNPATTATATGGRDHTPVAGIGLSRVFNSFFAWLRVENGEFALAEGELAFHDPFVAP
jgi:hypothetical protein